VEWAAAQSFTPGASRLLLNACRLSRSLAHTNACAVPRIDAPVWCCGVRMRASSFLSHACVAASAHALGTHALAPSGCGQVRDKHERALVALALCSDGQGQPHRARASADHRTQCTATVVSVAQRLAMVTRHEREWSGSGAMVCYLHSAGHDAQQKDGCARSRQGASGTVCVRACVRASV
jgi:hypothetical protein